MHTPTRVPIPSPSESHTAGKVSWGSDQGHHGATGTASPQSLLRSRCGAGRNLKLRPVSVTNPLLQHAARARGCLTHPLSFTDCIRVPKTLPGEMLTAFRVIPALIQQQVMGSGKELGWGCREPELELVREHRDTELGVCRQGQLDGHRCCAGRQGATGMAVARRGTTSTQSCELRAS